MTKGQDMRGFSIIELLIVCVVAGLIATIAVPHLQKAVRAAENGNAFATMRSMSSTQASFYAQNGRFGRLNEINNVMSGAIGTPSGPNDLIRGKFVMSMSPAVPSDAELREGFTITARRDVPSEGVLYVYELTGRELRQVLP